LRATLRGHGACRHRGGVKHAINSLTPPYSSPSVVLPAFAYLNIFGFFVHVEHTVAEAGREQKRGSAIRRACRVFALFYLLLRGCTCKYFLSCCCDFFSFSVFPVVRAVDAHEIAFVSFLLLANFGPSLALSQRLRRDLLLLCRMGLNIFSPVRGLGRRLMVDFDQ